MRRLALALVLLVALAAPAAPARAQTDDPVDRAVAAFHGGDPVYIDPGAELASAVSAKDAAGLRKRIKDGKRSVFVAVLPASAIREAGGDAAAVPALLHRRSGYAGTFAVVAGSSFRAASTDFPGAKAKALADAAFAAKREAGPAAVLAAFVSSVEGSGGGSGRAGWIALAIVLLALVVGFLTWTRRRDADVERRTVESVRRTLKTDLAALAGDVRGVQAAVGTRPEAGPELAAALTRLQYAAGLVDRVQAPADLGRLCRVAAEAQYALARTRAVLERRDPPPPPADLAEPGPHGEPAVGMAGGVPVYAGGGGDWYVAPWFAGAAVGG